MTSEQFQAFDDVHPRRFTARRVLDDFSIETIGKFNTLSRVQAHKLAKMSARVRDYIVR